LEEGVFTSKPHSPQSRKNTPPSRPRRGGRGKTPIPTPVIGGRGRPLSPSKEKEKKFIALRLGRGKKSIESANSRKTHLQSVPTPVRGKEKELRPSVIEIAK